MKKSSAVRNNSLSDNLPITKFEGYYNFLSNDFPSWVYYEGLLYPSINIAFQAARTTDPEIRNKLANIEDVQEFRSIATNIINPEGWANCKQKIMQIMVRDKFKRNKQIQLKLMGTKDKKLVNSMKQAGFNELYWGVFEGEGKNILGKILMKIREQFHQGSDTKNWIEMNLSLEKNIRMIAKVQLLVVKNGKKIDKLFFDKQKSYYMFGSLKTVDFHLENPTISRNHACIFFSNDLEVVLVDLNSTHGTSLKRGAGALQRVDCLMPYKLDKGDIIQFGTSERQYVVEIDREEVEAYIKNVQENLKNQIDSQDLDQFVPDEMNEKQAQKFLGLGNKCLLVSGISDQKNYSKLKDDFERFGKVMKIRMNINRKTGKFQGQAVVYFEKNETIDDVLKNANEIKYKLKSISEESADCILKTSEKKEEKEKELQKRKDGDWKEKMSEHRGKKQKRRRSRSRDRKDRSRSRDRKSRSRSRNKKSRKS